MQSHADRNSELTRQAARVLDAVACDRTICEENREVFKNFHDRQVADAIAPSKIVSRLFELKRIARLAGDVSFRSLTRAEAEALVLKMETATYMRGGQARPYSAESRRSAKALLKLLVTWLKGGDEVPPEVKWIRAPVSRNRHMPDEILTEEDALALVRHARSRQDRAIIMLLFESGLRASELLGLAIKHLCFQEGTVSLTATGKTGRRRILLVAATGYLLELLEEHPRAQDPEAPLWLRPGHPEEALSYSALRSTLARTARLAGVTRRSHPHAFRHAAATRWASRMPEATLRQVMGWSAGSTTPQIYTHLSQKTIGDAVLRCYGRQANLDARASLLTPRDCPNPKCRYSNGPDRESCVKCHAALVVPAIAEPSRSSAVSSGDGTVTEIDALFQDPDVRDLMRRKLAALRVQSTRKGPLPA